MEEKIEVLGIQLDYLNVEQAMEKVRLCMEKDRLSTIGIITMSSVLEALEDESWKNHLENLDLGVIGERIVLKAAGIESGEVYDEIGSQDFYARLFWYLILKEMRFFLIGETEKETDLLRQYLLETYPDIHIVGSAYDLMDSNMSVDRMLNKINGSSPDIIISGLGDLKQERFLLCNRQKILGKLWISFGEQEDIREAAGLRRSFFEQMLKKTAFRRLMLKYHGE